MAAFRITKYDPALRTESGAYPFDDWTTVRDVGQIRRGKRVTIQDYLLAEDRYLRAVRSLMVAADVERLRLSLIDPGPEPLFGVPEALVESTSDDFALIGRKRLLKGPLVDAAIRLGLRTGSIGELCGPNGFYLQISDDMYVYCGFYYTFTRAPSGQPVLPMAPEGLFFEEFPSPFFYEMP